MVRVHLDFFGTFDPDDVARRVGLTPRYTRRAGDVVRSIVTVREDTWSTVLAENEAYAESDLSPLLERAMDMVAERADAIRSLCRAPNVRGVVCVSLFIPPESFIPGLEITPSWCCLLGDANLTFVVDGSLLAPDDPLDV
jgi:hypothetical protein